MPRKVRGRPVSYGPAQLRALDTFLRENYLMMLSGNDTDLLKDGWPFHENGKAFFNVDHLHVEFLKASNYKITARQTSFAMAEIGVHSIQRRFGDGARMRIYSVAIPEGAYCEPSDKERAEYNRLRRPGWHGEWVGEPWVKAIREYELHGVSRATVRFVKADFETYDESNRVRALQAIFNDERPIVREYFEQLRVEHFLDLGGYKVNFWRPCFHSLSDFKQISPYTYFETINDSIFDAALHEAPDKAKYLLDYYPDGTPAEHANLLQLSNGLGKSAKAKAVALLQHLPLAVMVEKGSAPVSSRTQPI